MTAHGFQLKRVYDDPAADDGARILIDRLWPRGVSKERADLDEWDRELAPSTDLRKWFHADKDGRFEEFSHRYAAELGAPDVQPHLEALRERAEKGTVTLLTGTAEPAHSYLKVLLDALDGS
jgi:uncharacterized protein YeaO (DUF488 family)